MRRWKACWTGGESAPRGFHPRLLYAPLVAMNVLRLFAFSLFLFSLAACAPSTPNAPQATAGKRVDPPSTGTVRGDARLIITSKKGDVRLWDRPPRVLILSNDDRAEAIMQAIREKIETSVKSPFGPTFFSSWEYRKLADQPDLETAPTYFNVAKNKDVFAEIELAYPDGDKETADIVVLVADRITLSLYNSLWGQTARYIRRQAAGRRYSCVYSSQSKNGVRYGAYASTLSGESEEDLRACLWEEFLHTLGPLIDADGSPFFSFNESVDDEGLQANDILLIRALYESGAKPGDPPDKVLDYLDTLFASQ